MKYIKHSQQSKIESINQPVSPYQQTNPFDTSFGWRFSYFSQFNDSLQYFIRTWKEDELHRSSVVFNISTYAYASCI